MIGDPLVDDQLVARAEELLRDRYPNIPSSVQFATYIQPKTFHEKDGLTLPLPETAVFIVRVPSPKADHKGWSITESWGERLDQWRIRERANTVGVLVAIFESLLRNLASKHKNLRMMVVK